MPPGITLHDHLMQTKKFEQQFHEVVDTNFALGAFIPVL